MEFTHRQSTAVDVDRNPKQTIRRGGQSRARSSTSVEPAQKHCSNNDDSALREGDRYRQASVDGLTRLSTVLSGGEDPGPPQEVERITLPTNIPTKAETAESDATKWVIILLVLGTIIPMATWWVFSR